MLSIENEFFATEFESGTTKLVAYQYIDRKDMRLTEENCFGYWICEEANSENVFTFFDAIRAVDTTTRLAIYDINEEGTPGTEWLYDHLGPERSD